MDIILITKEIVKLFFILRSLTKDSMASNSPEFIKILLIFLVYSVLCPYFYILFTSKTALIICKMSK